MHWVASTQIWIGRGDLTVVPAACKGQDTIWEKIFYKNGRKRSTMFETIRRENRTSRDKGGVDFFMRGIYVYLYCEGSAKNKKEIKRKSLSLGQAEVLEDRIPVTVVREKGK